VPAKSSTDLRTTRGTYPLVFKASGEEKTITFRDINPFIQGGDKLVVAADQLAYRFKLKQGLIPKIKVSVLPDFNFSTPERLPRSTRILVTDMHGRLIYESEKQIEGKTIDLRGHVSRGLYFIHCVSDNTTYSGKLIIR